MKIRFKEPQLDLFYGVKKVYFLETEIKGNINTGVYDFYANIEECKVLNAEKQPNAMLKVLRKGKQYFTIIPFNEANNMCFFTKEAVLRAAEERYLNYHSDLPIRGMKINGKRHKLMCKAA